MAKVEEAGERMTGAPDIEGFERAGRALGVAARSLRQVIAMKQRFDREQAALAAEARRGDEAGREDAERERDHLVGRHRVAVRRHFERVLWDEYEADDAQEIFNDLDERLDELADDDDFLETPVETLIARLAEEFTTVDAEDEPSEEVPSEDDPSEDDPSEDGPLPAEPDAEPDEDHPPIAAGYRPVAEAPPLEPVPEPEPPPRPPDPPPDPPYIPPWDRVPPARFGPGGSGW